MTPNPVTQLNHDPAREGTIPPSGDRATYRAQSARSHARPAERADERQHRSVRAWIISSEVRSI